MGIAYGEAVDDLFDALDHAVTTAFRPKRRRRKSRSRKVGVIGGPVTPALRRSRVR